MRNIGIAITAYDRVEWLRQCIRKLEESSFDSEFSIHVFPDAVDDAWLEEIKSACESKVVRVYIENTPTKHLGADLNILRSLEEISKRDYTHIIKLDSDILVAPNFIHDLVELSDFVTGMATSNLYGKDTKQKKIQDRNNITKWIMSGANFCMRRGDIGIILPMAKALMETYKLNGHNPSTTEEEWSVMKTLLRLYKPNHNEFNSPHRDFMLNSNVPNTGSDAMIAVAVFCAGIPAASYAVNRAIHPSCQGVNTTMEFWKENYKDVSLDDLPKAESREFVFV